MAETKEREAGEFDQGLTDFISKKNNTIAWVVSNCDVSSGRMEYVNVLKKYINITAYGKCNGNPCPGENCCKSI